MHKQPREEIFFVLKQRLQPTTTQPLPSSSTPQNPIPPRTSSSSHLSRHHAHNPLLGIAVVPRGVGVRGVLDELRLLTSLVPDRPRRCRGHLRADKLSHSFIQ